MKRIFLGGTISTDYPLYGWRGRLISMLNDEVDYFIPISNNYSRKVMDNIYDEKYNKCDCILYVITPDINEYYSIADIAYTSVECGHKVIFCFLNRTYENNRKFNRSKLNSLKRIGSLVESHGGKCFRTLEDVANYINNN